MAKNELKKLTITIDESALEIIDRYCEEYSTNRSNAVRIILKNADFQDKALKSIQDFNKIAEDMAKKQAIKENTNAEE